jgi:hypothetical protein
VLADERGRFILEDNEKNQVVAERLLQPLFCLRAGSATTPTPSSCRRRWRRKTAGNLLLGRATREENAMKLLAGLGLALGIALSAGRGGAAAWPERPITFVVPYAPAATPT